MPTKQETTLPINQRRKRRINSDNAGKERTVVIMYHKPPNVITSHSNSDKISQNANGQTNHHGRRTVYEDIYSMNGFTSIGSDIVANQSFEQVTKIQSKLHAIGRLDADTTGLLLLTNDGALVHKITNPNAKINAGGDGYDGPVQKTYEATIMGYHTLPTIESLQRSTTSEICNNDNNHNEYASYPLQQLINEGVALSAKHGGQTKPVDALSILSHPSRSTTRVSITISEGKNRQIRRMFHAVGSGVMKLHRVSVGRLTLHGLLDPRDEEIQDHQSKRLEEGEWRLLNEDEIERGLGWKCRCIDQVSNTRVTNGSSGGRRHNHSQRRKPSTKRNRRRR